MKKIHHVCEACGDVILPPLLTTPDWLIECDLCGAKHHLQCWVAAGDMCDICYGPGDYDTTTAAQYDTDYDED